MPATGVLHLIEAELVALVDALANGSSRGLLQKGNNSAAIV